MNLSEPFVRRPVMTALLTVSVILFGTLAYYNLPVNDLPVVDYPVIAVSVVYPGASPETMANNVATPLERQFMQIPGLELVTSSSTQGFCSLTLQFDLNKSIDAAATDVQTAITQATGNLPTDLPSPPTFSKTNPNDQPLIYVALSSDTMTAGSIYDFANTQVGERISIVPGVSRVLVYGTKAAIRIKANPSAMAIRGITLDDLSRAIQTGTSYTGAGQFDGPDQTMLIQPHGQLENAEAYNNLIVGTTDGAPIYLRDVATATDSVENERTNMRFWVRGTTVPGATVVIAIFRQAGANAVEVAGKCKALLPIINAELPGSVKLVPIYDRSLSIVNSLRDVEATLIIAFVLVVGVIFLFLGRVKDTLIPAVALPLSLLLTFIVMELLGYTLDNLSLMALTLAIGFLVDDAIVFLENTVRRMEDGERPLQATINSAKEISFTILSMTISLAAVFLPLVLMPGLVGRIFREFAITIIVSIFASGLVSLTLTPLMCSRLLDARGKGTRKTIIERISGAIEHRVLAIYGRSLTFFLHNRWISALVWVGCLAGTIYLFTVLPKSFLPPGDSGFIFGFMLGPDNASPTQMLRFQKKAEAVLQSDPNVDLTFSATGVQPFLTSNQGFLLALLKPVDQRPPIQVVAQTMQMKLFGLPGFFAFLRPNPVLEISTGATNQNQGQFAYALSGINPDQVYEVANKLIARLNDKKAFPGFATISSDYHNNTVNLDIQILRDQASMYNVSVGSIQSLLRTAYSQNYVYLVKKPEDQYQVILEVQDVDRSKSTDLSRLYVRSEDGKNLVPLSAVVQWKQTKGLQAVNHINQFTSVSIYFNLLPGVPIGAATDFIEKTAKEVLPITVRGGLQGEALTFSQTMTSLVILMALAVFVMYVVLGILYESYLHPITVLTSLPVALVGGLATLWLWKADASLYAFVGMFMLMGIVKKNGIMIVDFALQRIAKGASAEEAIHEASMDRFRPIIMTTMAAIMGALPIALGYGADGDSRKPLGLVIVGGLVVSQFITLYVTPALYLYLEDFQEHVLDRTSFFRSSRAHAAHEATLEERRQELPEAATANVE